MVFGSYDGLPLPRGSFLPLPHRSYDGLPLYLMDPMMVFLTLWKLKDHLDPSLTLWIL